MEAIGIRDTNSVLERMLIFALVCSLTATVCGAIESATRTVERAVSHRKRVEAVMPSEDRYPVGFV